MTDSGGETEAPFGEIVDELAAASTALGNEDREPSLTETERLADLVGDATVVGLGETGHGVHEMYSQRARLCRILIEEQGYRHIALEADFAGTRAIDEYVRGGEESVEDALGTPGVHGFWRNEAMASFLEWARSFNEGRPEDDRIRFHGVDIVQGGPVGEELTSYLETVDPSLLDVLAEELQTVIETPTPFGIGGGGSAEQLQALADSCERLVDRLRTELEQNRDSYRNAGGERALERARRGVELLASLGEMMNGLDEAPPVAAIEARNRALAEGIAWLLDSGRADRVVFLASLLHVKRGTWREPLGEVRATGEFIHRRLGRGYRPIGARVATGNTRVFDDGTAEAETVAIPSPPAGSLSDALSAVGHESAVLDFGTLSDTGAAASWLTERPVVRELATSAGEDATTEFEVDPREEFDGLLFVREATAVDGLGE